LAQQIGAPAGSINNREAAQRKFIGSGNEDGCLTGSEARRLGNQQLKMEHKEQYFRADGDLTRRESENINAPRYTNQVNFLRKFLVK